MDNIKQFFSRFLPFWENLKLWQKASLFGAAFGVFALLFIAVMWARSTSFEPLHSGLDLNDQAAIVEYLNENRIPFQVDSTAGAILVPRHQLYEARLALASMGIPRGSSRGFEIFDNRQIGTSEFERQIAYARAVEGELQRTIEHMNAVDSARVRIVVPRPQLFLERREPSQASVFLTLRPGARLLPDHVRSIVFLVSRSVEGLEPDRVIVMDSMGNDLTAMIVDEPGIIRGEQNEADSIQRQVERRIERELVARIRSMHERTFGFGNVHAEVRVEMDFDRRESLLTEFFPFEDTGQGIIRSTEFEEESFAGTGAPVTTAPGTTTNIPGYAINQGQNAESTYDRARTTRNMEITTRQTNEVITPGTIRRLTASVVINREDMTEAQLADIRSLTANAIGYSAARGDDIVISAWTFDDSFAVALLEELRRERLMRLVTGIIIALLVMAAVIFVIMWWLRRRRERVALGSIQEDSKRVPTIQEMLTSPDLLAFQGEMAVLEEQLRAYARNNPNEVANLVNEWISAD
jgi:flagellar M-ring protein FliF